MSGLRQREFAAVVTDIRLESRAGGRARWQIALDHTEFARGDEGELEATARSGACLRVPVIEVLLDGDGVVWHVLEKPLTEGTQVVARVLLRG